MHSGKNLEIIYENIVNKGWSYSSVAEHLPSTRPCDQSAAWQFTYLSIYLPIHPSTYPSIHLSIHLILYLYLLLLYGFFALCTCLFTKCASGHSKGQREHQILRKRSC